MASYFGIDTSEVSSYLGSGAASKNNSSTAASLLSSTAGSLSDYSLISSGAYKKLLTAYYAKNNSKTGTNEKTQTEKINLVKTKDDAVSLNKSVKELMKTDITDENRDSIKNSLKNIVESYNALIDTGSEVDDTKVLKNTLWMTQNTKALSETLIDIGITVGSDNKLTFDEEKFNKAELTTMKTLFNGTASFAGKLLQKSDSIAKLSSNAAAEDTKASAYTNKGDYNKITSSTLYDSLF